MTAEVSVPGQHASRMLQTATYAICAIGAIAVPFTLKVVPAALPSWVTASLIAGQLVVLVVVTVAVSVTRPSVGPATGE